MKNRSLGSRVYDLIPFVGPSLPENSRLNDLNRRHFWGNGREEYLKTLENLKKKGYKLGGNF
jgi:hypothetical protein